MVLSFLVVAKLALSLLHLPRLPPTLIPRTKPSLIPTPMAGKFDPKNAQNLAEVCCSSLPRAMFTPAFWNRSRNSESPRRLAWLIQLVWLICGELIDLL